MDIFPNKSDFHMNLIVVDDKLFLLLNTENDLGNCVEHEAKLSKNSQATQMLIFQERSMQPFL